MIEEKIANVVMAGMCGVGECTFTNDGKAIFLVGQDGFLKVCLFFYISVYN